MVTPHFPSPGIPAIPICGWSLWTGLLWTLVPVNRTAAPAAGTAHVSVSSLTGQCDVAAHGHDC